MKQGKGETVSSLANRRSLWIHQYDQLAEESIAAICATAKQYAGADLLLKKLYDGARLMDGSIDHDPLAPASLADFRAQQAAAAALGVALLPWINVTQHDQAALHAQAGPALVL